MNISSDLQSLINASLTDGKISSKERKVLMSRAESDGLNLDEFELYLNSLVQEANKDKKNVVEKSAPIFKWIFSSPKRIAGVAVVIVILVVWIGSLGSTEEESQNDDLVEKYECENVEDCLVKYNFEAARAFASIASTNSLDDDNKSKSMKKIITQESNYWIDNGEFDRGLTVVEVGKDYYRGEYDIQFEAAEYEVAKYGVISMIVDALLDKEEFKEAKRWALKSCDCNISGRTKAKQKDYDGGKSKWDESASMKNTLLKKIKETEKLMK